MSETPLRILLIDANHDWLTAGQPDVPRQVVLPTGLMYLSAAARQAFGQAVEIQLINTAIDGLTDDELAGRIRQFAPTVVGIRGLSLAKDFFAKLAQQVRAAAPTATLLVGGPYPTNQPEEALRRSGADFAVIGEGERTFVRLLERLRAGQGAQPAHDVPGIAYLRGDEMVLTPPAELIADLDCLPIPDYGVIDQARYAQALSYAYTMRPSGVIVSSRGCPFRCKYCLKMMGDHYRPRSPGSVVDEIAYLQEVQGLRDILFVDDNFNLQPNRVRAIFEQVLARGLKCNFYFPSGLRADLLTTDLVDLLAEAGAAWITFAIETIVPRVQELAGRSGDPAKAAAIIDHACAKQIMVGLFFMVGFPTETFQEAMATLEYVRDRRQATMPYFFAVKYFPGTELTRLALESGAISPSQAGAASTAYHDISASRTSTLTSEDFQNLFTFYLKDILLSGPRLSFALKVQQQHLTPHELASAYSVLLGRKIADPRRTFRFALQGEE